MFDMILAPFRVELHASPRQLPRVIIDPNEHSPVHPDLSPVLLEDLPEAARQGTTVIASQPDDDGGPDYITYAIVKVIDHDRRLAYLAVDWEGFHNEVPWFDLSAQFNTAASSPRWQGHFYTPHNANLVGGRAA